MLRRLQMATKSRNPYIDFLRALGLLLLVVAHTFPPEWLKAIRTFDVPLMVFISSICYKPLCGGGYLAYCMKRFKRIYIPVAIFLTLFFGAELLSLLIIGKPNMNLKVIVGSYLLLNYPGIGYVWIMRVFIMMALITPLMYEWLCKTRFLATIIIIGTIIVLQKLFASMTPLIDSDVVRFIVDETLLYAVGYSAIAILGVKITQFSHRQIIIVITIATMAVAGYVLCNNMIFDPQATKYPPQSLYILYGLMCSAILWWLQPFLSSLGRIRFFAYLSKNSMWIYLWHIIPVYMIAYLNLMPKFWIGRYLITLFAALGLNWGYQYMIKFLPNRIHSIVK